MSFSDDFARWVRRELARRLHLFPHRTAEAIRRLIDYPPDSLRRAPGNRPEIPGVPGVALLFVPEEPTPPELIAERGLGLVIDSVYRVYIDADLASEWSGDPDDWGWGEAVHSQGVMTPGGFQCSSATAPTWSPLPPLDGQQSYSTLATASELDEWFAGLPNPHQSTGLMRLLIESWGPFQDVRDLVPGTWPPFDPAHYGIVRMQDTAVSRFRWWLVYLGTAGCKAVELQFDGMVQCLVDGLYPGSTWNNERRQQAEAWALRGAYVFDGDEGAELISAEDYGNAVTGAPLAHGWKFCHQRQGSPLVDQAEAMIVSLDLRAGAYDTQTMRCGFALVGGALQAGLQVVATGRAHFGSAVRHNPLWLESQGKLQAVEMDEAAPPDVIDLSDVFVVDYSDTEPLVVKRVMEEFITSPAEPGRTGTTLNACAGESGDSEQWWRTATNIWRGGWVVGSVEASREVVTSAGEHVARDFQIDHHGAVIDVGTFADTENTGLNCYFDPLFDNVDVASALIETRTQQCDEDELIGCTTNDLPFGYRWQGVRWAQGTKHIFRRWERTYDSSNFGGNALIIPASCSTAVILCSGQSIAQETELSPGGDLSKDLPLDQFQGTRRFDFLPGIRGAYLFSLGRYKAVCAGFQTPPDQDPVCREGNWVNIAWSSCSVGDPEGACISSNPYQIVQQRTEVKILDAHVVTGSAVISGDPDWDQWHPLLKASATGGEEVAWSPQIAVQYGGPVLYQAKPNGPLKSDSGHHAQSIEDAQAARFVMS